MVKVVWSVTILSEKETFQAIPLTTAYETSWAEYIHTSQSNKCLFESLTDIAVWWWPG